MPEKRKAPKGCYWRGGILWGRVTVQGREVRFSLRTDDAKVAESRRKARQSREVAAAHFGDQRRTWEDAVLAWGEHISAHAKPSTVKRYAVSLKQLEPYLLGCYLDEIDKRLVGDIIRRRRAGCATNATIRRDLTALSSVLGYCEEEGWRDDNPALSRMRRVKERREPIVLPDLEHIAAVVAKAPGMFARMIEAALMTGCRQAELVTLERRQLDFGRRQLSLYRTKTSRPRVIDMLGAYDLLRSAPVNMRSPVVFWHGQGEPYRNVASRFAAIVRAAQKAAQQKGGEFRPFRFHDLRHRFAVDYLKNGGNLYALQQHLGHSSVKVTEGYLAYLTPDEAMAAKHGAGTKTGTAITVQGSKQMIGQED
jgi:integrase/recombinase XerD